MNDEPITVTLSRDELLLTLRLLEAETIPGLDDDPFGPMSEEQRTLAHVVAGRSLRARGLAQLNAEGDLTLHAGVLTAVGACAYAHKSLFLVHWPAPEETPRRYFGHVREEETVAHTRPADVLHQFLLLPSRDRLVAQALDFCGCGEMGGNGRFEFTISGRAFAGAREEAESGSGEEAAEVLTEAGVAAEAAEALVATLRQGLRVTIFQTLRLQEDRTQKRDFTVLQNADYGWLLIPTENGNDEEGERERTLRVKTTTGEEISALLAEILA